MDNYKNVLIYGYGKSGKSIEKLLKIQKVDYKIYDENIKLSGGNYLSKVTKSELKLFDLIVVSPGVSLNNKSLKLAKSMGIKIIGELEFGYQNINKNLISVTGTNGKTTTVTLINEILKNKYNSCVAGNIGTPLTDIALNNSDCNCVVCEVSSFQLETIDQYKSNINVLLNIGDDHLDRYGNIKKYAKAKFRLFENNTENTINILNFDDEITKEWLGKIKGVKYYFSLSNECKGVYLKDDQIIVNTSKQKRVLCKLSEFDFPKLFLEDIMACVLVSVIMNIDDNSIIKTIKGFKLLQSRVEKVGEFNGVSYINDSKATNMHAVLACVKSIDSDIILMLGGRNKGFNFKNLIRNLPNTVKSILCFGECGNAVYKSVIKNSSIQAYILPTLDEAINKAWAIAWSGSSVVLSPACASFDEFNSYSERGEFFKNKILKLGSQK